MKTLTRIVPSKVYHRIISNILNRTIDTKLRIDSEKGFIFYLTKEGILGNLKYTIVHEDKLYSYCLWSSNAILERLLFSNNAAIYKIKIIPSNNFISFSKTKL